MAEVQRGRRRLLWYAVAVVLIVVAIAAVVWRTAFRPGPIATRETGALTTTTQPAPLPTTSSPVSVNQQPSDEELTVNLLNTGATRDGVMTITVKAASINTYRSGNGESGNEASGGGGQGAGGVAVSPGGGGAGVSSYGAVDIAIASSAVACRAGGVGIGSRWSFPPLARRGPGSSSSRSDSSTRI